MEEIVNQYENYFNLIYGNHITAIKDLVEKETEWIDIHRGTTLMIFELKEKKKGIRVEIHSIRHMLVEKLLDNGYVGVLGENKDFWIEDEEKVHGFFKLLEEIDYFNH